ncbi:hypothetical protein SCHPADRAFT_995057 [Schizopora paradoxa]|uniref:Amine oxidase domain-containing protein n=1 Tax=Schizopora paradoxa TaxID=27342 RepID=A0A0H2S472_9AGAM|nr:hypothetical protein SCHPADRAFT_995057 [Schizopora paradoxa]
MPSISIHDAHALRLIEKSLSEYQGLPILPSDFSAQEPAENESEEKVARALNHFTEALSFFNIPWPPPPPPPERTRRIGIIGAGAAGLYVAMILESLDLKFEILEASGRIGGRLLTHKLGSGKNEYYDVGAMRFPDNPIMERTFDLFKRLDFTTENGKLIEYIMSTDTDTYLYNNKSAPASALKPEASGVDTFGFSKGKGGTVPQSYFEQGYQHWIDLKIKRLRNLLKDDFEGEGWKALMKVDRHSMRSYMSLNADDLSGEMYPTEVVNWCETLDVGTGMYDTALSEAVLDSLDFDYGPNVKWYAVQGGAENIAIAMAESLKHKPLMKKRVVGVYPRISFPFFNPKGGNLGFGGGAPEETPFIGLAVKVEGETSDRLYEHVISTLPFGMLRLVDTRFCGFSYALDEAIRSLRYDASVKVAIQFTKRWWEEEPYKQFGGQSKTDRPTRVVVYPSYGIGGADAVLLASYSWSQDASRFGALVHGNDSESERVLIDIILRDISDIHGIRFSELKGMLKSHDAWDWYHDEYSSGAFALFGPAQFSSMYPQVTRPAAGGRFHFAGEAASATHAWVVGALNSAYRCVEEILVEDNDRERLKMLKEKWGHVDEVKIECLVRQIAVGIHESSKLAKDVQIEQTPVFK